MEYTTISDWVDNDRTHIYRITDYGEWPVTHWDVDRLQPGQLFYLPSALSYGDYVPSSEIERSNVRIFQQRFAGIGGWITKQWQHDAVAICLDLTCDNPKIIAVLAALQDYPIIDDEDCSKMSLELEDKAWHSYLEKDFIKAIQQRFKADDSNPQANELRELYHQLKEQSNTDITFFNGEVHIDLTRLTDVLTQSPACAHLEWW